jgi:hypothetical protein
LRRRTGSPAKPTDLNSTEEIMPLTGAKMAEHAETPTPNQEDTVKMTLYIKKSVAKEFKKLAIEKEQDYSKLATLAFSQFVENEQQT